MVRVILLGLPGSGKSTQSAMIANCFSVPAISAGALLREAVELGTETGRTVHEYLRRGDLAPNQIVDGLVFERLSRPDSKGGFVLDGFPRTFEQARSLEEFIRQTGQRLQVVIHLKVPSSVVVSRLGARRICPVCGAVYNLRFDRPEPGDICYACGTPLRYSREGFLECEACKVSFVLRDDDRPEIIRQRLLIQRAALRPVLAYFHKNGLLVETDASRAPEEVFDDIWVVLGGRQRQAGGT